MSDAYEIKPDGTMHPEDIAESFQLKRVDKRHPMAAGGTWAVGTIAGHEFNALVFAEPANEREWEVGGDSRISKLWLARISDRKTVFNWDRGEDIAPQTPLATQIVDALAAGLAETVFGE
jgi:hypothetical protein